MYLLTALLILVAIVILLLAWISFIEKNMKELILSILVLVGCIIGMILTYIVYI